jgi:membrane protein
MILDALRVPIGWGELTKRTYREVLADNCFGLAAQLSYYFVLALFPALLFLVALISFVPVQGLLDYITTSLSRVAPYEALSIIQDQILKLAQQENGGLLTIGMLGTIWSTSAGVTAIIDTLNRAYDIEEGRSWWKVRLVAIALTVALAVFIVLSTVLVVAGPTLAERVAEWLHLGMVFEWTWKIVQWPLVFGIVSLAIAIVYYYAPDARQEWIWITPGSILATFLWLLISLAFKVYVSMFGEYNATYGTIGGFIVLMLWFYFSGLAVLIGAELNAEIEHASPYGKEPGEKVAGEKRAIGRLAARLWNKKQEEAKAREPEAIAAMKRLPPGELALAPAEPVRPRFTEWLVGLSVLGALTYKKVRSSFQKLRA